MKRPVNDYGPDDYLARIKSGWMEKCESAWNSYEDVAKAYRHERDEAVSLASDLAATLRIIRGATNLADARDGARYILAKHSEALAKLEAADDS